MYLLLLTIIPLYFCIKAASFGVYEIRTKNIIGGIAVLTLSAFSFFAALKLIYG